MTDVPPGEALRTPRLEHFESKVPGSFGEVPDVVRHQQGPAVQHAIHDEVIPWIAARWSVAVIDRHVFTTNQERLERHQSRFAARWAQLPSQNILVLQSQGCRDAGPK